MAVTTPVLPGVYPEYDAARRTLLPQSPGVIVALQIVHSWGPVNEPQLCADLEAFETVFGTDDSPGRIAVEGALKGEGLAGAGGAGSVLVTRTAAVAAAKASRALSNPAAAAALTVRGRYTGTRGNRFNIQVLPVVGGAQEVVLLDGTVELESYTYTIAATAALAGLAEHINDASDFVEVPTPITQEGATGLAPGTFALTGGNDGATLTGADWLSGVAPLQDFDFALYSPYDLPYASGVGAAAVRDAINSLIAWRDQREAEGQGFTAVFGMALDTLPQDAIDAAKATLNPGVIFVGGPGYNDDVLGALSMSQMAPRYAGIRAQRGEGMATHMARLAGGTPRPLPTGSRVSLSEVEDMTVAGVVTIQRDRWVTAPTRVVKDVNTYAPEVRDPVNEPEDRPAAIWGNPKFVMSMQQFANDARAEIEREMIGKVVVNDTTRAAAAARVLRMAKDRERIGAFNAGTKVEPVAGSDTDDFITVRVTLTFGRALAYLFIKGTVR